MKREKRTSDEGVTMIGMEQDAKRMIHKIEKQSTPWYEKNALIVTAYIMLILADAAALLMTITAVDDEMSPVFVIAPTVVFSLFFVIAGDFVGKQAGIFIVSKIRACRGEYHFDQKEQTLRIIGVVIPSITMVAALIATAALRWETRDTAVSIGSKPDGNAPVLESSSANNAFAILIMFLPLLVFLIAGFIEVARKYYAFSGQRLKATLTQKYELERMADRTKVLAEMMPDEDERLTVLNQYENDMLEANKQMVDEEVHLTVAKSRDELMKLKNMTADQISVVTDW